MTAPLRLTGPAHRARRLVRLVVGVHGASPEPDADLPDRISISSDHVPTMRVPAFYRHVPVDRVVDSSSWSDDDPEGLRERGPRAVGEALVRLALSGQVSFYKDVREVAALILEWSREGMRHDRLDVDLGLVRRDGRPGLDLVARRAERDAALVALSRRPPFAAQGPWAAAGAIRAAVQAYEARRWPEERSRRSAPADDLGAVAWRVLRLDLPQGPLPGQADLRALIADDRERGAR